MTNIIEALEKVEAKLIKTQELGTDVAVLADRLTHLEQKSSAAFSGPTSKSAGLGAQVWKAMQDNADLLRKTDRVRLEIKAAGDALTTTSARTIQGGVVGTPAGMALGVHLALPTRGIGAVSAYEYSKYLALEGAAAQQAAEGDAKAAVRPTFSLITQPALTIAGYSKISKQALSDSNELKQAVDITLRRSIYKALDSILNTGTWGGANGFLAHATAYTSLVYTGLADAASEGVAFMQEAGFSPDTVVMKPGDWLAITTAKATGGEYLSGSYLAPLPELLRGLKVVLSPTITAGKVMLLDSSQCELLVVEDLGIEIGTDQDDFTRNIRTILGEMRVIPTFRAVGAGRLITPKA